MRGNRDGHGGVGRLRGLEARRGEGETGKSREGGMRGTVKEMSTIRRNDPASPSESGSGVGAGGEE